MIRVMSGARGHNIGDAAALGAATSAGVWFESERVRLRARLRVRLWRNGGEGSGDGRKRLSVAHPALIMAVLGWQVAVETCRPR